MATWRSKVARSAWTAFLVLFAVRAIAGTALCEIYGEHGAPPVAPYATEARVHAPHEAREHASRTKQPSNESKEHICDEPVYLTGEAATPSVVKGWLTTDAMPWSHAPAQAWKPVIAVVRVAPPQLAHPPPSRAPLDISPRLRI